jgi:hypothetical protein
MTYSKQADLTDPACAEGMDNSMGVIEMNNGLIQRWLAAMAASIFLNSFAAAAGSDIDFTSVVSDKVNINGTMSVTVTLHGIEVDLVVTEGTAIEVGGEEATFDDLSIYDFVRVEAFFAEEGIVAEEIKVLDSQKEEFRMRGIVQAIAAGTEDITLMVLNIDIVVPPDTDITRRGSRAGNNVSPAELQVGDVVNIFGLYEDMSLVARRIHVGSRPQGLIELEGEIISVSSDNGTLLSITMLVGGAVEVTVMIDENTFIGGTLAEKAFVEVRGQLDENLTLLGFEIIVDEDGDGDADDDNRRGRGRGPGNNGGPGNGEGPELEIEAETSLTALSGELKGKVKVRYEEDGAEVKQKFEIEIEDANGNSNYAIEVDFGTTTVAFGTLSTDGEGEGEIEFSTSPDAGEQDLTPLIPTGSDIRDITAIRVYDGTTLVLEGSF